MDVALFPVLSGPAAPAAGDLRAVQGGEAVETVGQFGSALASALGEAEPSETSASVTDADTAARLSLSADWGGGAAPAESRSGHDDSSKTNVATAMLGFLGFAWELPLRPIPAAELPEVPQAGDLPFGAADAVDDLAQVADGMHMNTPAAGAYACLAPVPSSVAMPSDCPPDAAPPQVDGIPTPQMAEPGDLNTTLVPDVATGRSAVAAPVPDGPASLPAAMAASPAAMAASPAAMVASPAAVTAPSAGRTTAATAERTEDDGAAVPAPDAGRPDMEASAVKRRHLETQRGRAGAPTAPMTLQGTGRIAVARLESGLDASLAVTSDVQPTVQGESPEALQKGPVLPADTWISRAYQRSDAVLDDVSAGPEAVVREAIGAVARASADGTARGRDDAPDRGTARHAATTLAAAYGTARPVGLDLQTRVFDLGAAIPAQEAVAPSTSSGEPLEHAIVKSLKLQWNQGIGEARLQLRPEYLGELTVALRVQGSTVTAILQSDSPAVRAWVEHHQDELRRALEEAGLSLDSLTVDADGHARDQQQQTAPDDRRQQPSRRPVPPGRFEALL